MKDFPRGSFAAALAILLFTTSAWAQATAEVRGTVRDESGAVLPGVTVVATQVDIGFSRTPVTNLDAGNFGQTISQTGDPRIMQFGIKYGF